MIKDEKKNYNTNYIFFPYRQQFTKHYEDCFQIHIKNFYFK